MNFFISQYVQLSGFQHLTHVFQTVKSTYMIHLLKYLKSTNVWLILISMAGLLFACELDDPNIEILAQDVIRLKSNVDSLEADGLQTFVLTAELMDKTDPNKDVVFQTSYGTFTNGDAPGTRKTTIKSSGRTALAYLKVTNIVEERIFVSAQLSGYACDKVLKATPAYPTSMILNTNDLFVQKNKGNIVTVSVDLRRNQGSVSNELPVNFSYVDTEGRNLLLLFRPIVFSSNGRVSIELQSLNNSVGPFILRATAPMNSLSDTIVKELQMWVE